MMDDRMDDKSEDAKSWGFWPNMIVIGTGEKEVAGIFQERPASVVTHRQPTNKHPVKKNKTPVPHEK